MMRIAVVDDDLFFAEMVEKEIGRFFASREEPVRVWRGHGNELLDLLGGQPGFDLYFLDVEMLGMNGLELSEKIFASQQKARIVLLTAYERFALPGIRLGVYYYILKDDYHAELQLILERFCRERAADREEYYYITTGAGGCRILMDSILYLAKEKKYTIFHCQNGRLYRERNTLENVFSRLSPEHFVMINRGMAINLEHLISFERLNVTLREGSILPVSRYAKTRVLDKLAEYWRAED